MNLVDPELQLISTKPVIKNKLKELLSEFKKLKVQTILVLYYKEKNGSKIFHWGTHLVASDSEIGEAYKSMHQCRMAKKYYTCKDWIVLDIIIQHSIQIFDC